MNRGPGFNLNVSGSNSPADWMPDHKPTGLSRIKLNLNLTTLPYEDRAFSPLGACTGIGLFLALKIYNVTKLLFYLDCELAREVISNRKETTCLFLTWPGFEFGRLGNQLSNKLIFHSETDMTAEDMMTSWKHFPRYWPFVREFTGRRWIPFTKASDAELSCFLWSSPEQTVE